MKITASTTKAATPFLCPNNQRFCRVGPVKISMNACNLELGTAFQKIDKPGTVAAPTPTLWDAIRSIESGFFSKVS
jgi:hypothetical protein